MKTNVISRRNFLKLTGVLAGSTAIALRPSKAFGWIAFEFDKKRPLWEKMGLNDPVHEDAAQFAYSIVLQRHKNNMEIGGGPDSILNPAYKFYPLKNYTPNQYFLENLKMLRYGAYWNDAAAYDPFVYLVSQLSKDNILEWNNDKSPYYENLLDIAEHLVQNKNRDYNEFIQFNSNGKLDCLHGMLNSYAQIESYVESVSQGLNKELIMQWFEAAYKFAVNGEKIPDTNLRYFFDTNNSYDPDLDVQMQIDDSISFLDDYETTYNTRQLRMRVLGMICHTIQDLWNPAHTIRSYYKDENDPDRFGTILAFGNYPRQNNASGSNYHKPYDLCCKIDPVWGETSLRDILINDMTPHGEAPERAPIDKENFLDNILNWNGSKYSKDITIEKACEQFNTLGLKYTIKYLCDFLEIAYLGLNWTGQSFYYNKNVDYHDITVSLKANKGFTKFNSVKEWFYDFVLKNMLDNNGDPYIYDSGIKTTVSEYEIRPFIENLSEVIKDHFGEKGETLIQLLTQFITNHKNYAELAIDFYTNHNTNGSDYVQDTPECKAKTAQDKLFQSLKNILQDSDCGFKKLILPQIDDFFDNLWIDQFASWNNLVKLICGFLQELYLETDESHSLNTDVLDLRSQLIAKDRILSFTGSVENVWEKNEYVHLQIRNEENTVISFSCDKALIDNYKYLKNGTENVMVNCDLASSIYDSGVYIFDVDSIKVPSVGPDYESNYFIRAKIDNVFKNTFSATLLDFSNEGSSTYLFEYDKSRINLERNSEYILTYKAKSNKLICIKAQKCNTQESEIVRHSSQIIVCNSNCLKYLVKSELPKELKYNGKLLESDLLYYDKSQICGELNKGENFDFICFGNGAANNNNNDNIAEGYKIAIRIKDSNYNKDHYMDFYIPSQNNKHVKTDKKLSSSILENCTFEDGKCIYCGNIERSEPQSTTPDTSDKNDSLIAAATGTAIIGAAGLAYEHEKEIS